MVTQLVWSAVCAGTAFKAVLDLKERGTVEFYMEYYPSCNLRGRNRLIIECPGSLMDQTDQTMRYYHDKEVAYSEAQRIATALELEG